MSIKDIGELQITLGADGVQRLLAQAVKQATQPKLPPFYYDSARRDFWMENNRGGWVPVTESAIKRELKMLGISPRTGDGEYVSPLDKAVSALQKDQDVAYAGPLAGYKSGVYTILGNRVLVTDSPRLIEPNEIAWPTIKAVVDGLLADPVHDQSRYLYGWLKGAVQSLRSGKHQPGQCLVIAGERGCGKSLLQKLITEILGGREARPFRYMRGGSEFNAELFGAEHLVIEDEEPSTDLRARRQFGTRVKELTVNQSQSCHPKHRQAISLTPFWRVTISLNDEPENIMVLPPMDDSLKDKFIILRARRKSMPMPTETAEQQAEFWQKLKDELPGFVHWLLTWELPEDLRDSRMGVAYFHHPEILNALNELSPESKLLDLIDEVLFSGRILNEWEGTAAELERRLTSDEQWGTEARKLLSFPLACSKYLGRLADKSGGRVKNNRQRDKRLWTIYAPERDTVTPDF